MLTLSLLSSKGTFSPHFQETMYKRGSENWSYNHFSSEEAMKSQVLHTV